MIFPLNFFFFAIYLVVSNLFGYFYVKLNIKKKYSFIFSIYDKGEILGSNVIIYQIEIVFFYLKTFDKHFF